MAKHIVISIHRTERSDRIEGYYESLEEAYEVVNGMSEDEPAEYYIYEEKASFIRRWGDAA
jgi:hypothetical protein